MGFESLFPSQQKRGPPNSFGMASFLFSLSPGFALNSVNHPLATPNAGVGYEIDEKGEGIYSARIPSIHLPNHKEDPMADSQALKVHITGVYGLIGNLVYRHLHAQPDRYDVYGSGRRTLSSVRADAESILRLPDDHFMIADLADAAAVAKAMQGMDVVLHIGALPNPDASFQEVLDSNIRGTHHVLEACRLAGVKRMVYASSIMATWGYYVYEEPYRSIREGRLDSLPNPLPVITHRHPG